MTRGYMGDIAGPGCDPDVGDCDSGCEDFITALSEIRNMTIMWPRLEAGDRLRAVHRIAVEALGGEDPTVELSSAVADKEGEK